MKIRLHHLYIFTTSIAMLMYFGLNRTPVPWWLSSMHCFIWIVIGLFYNNKHRRQKLIVGTEKSIFFLFETPYFFFWLFTLLAWIKNSYIEPDTISRAISLTLQYSLMVFYVIVMAKMFGDKLVKYTFNAAILNNIIVIIFAIVRWGIKDFTMIGLNPFGEGGSWTLDNLNVTAFLEVHDITFAFGFFLIYFFLFYEGKDKNKNIVLSALFIYLGLKRIQLVALFLVIGISIFITGKSKKGIKFWSAIATIVSLIVLNIFIFLINSNLISVLAAAYNINFMGRLRVYFNLSKYFNYSPGFFGYGMSYGRIIASELVEQNILNFTGHSDILMNYIDYGFWGFTIWIIFICYICSIHIIKRYTSKETTIWLLCTLYAIITYLTDNTTMYFCFQTIYMIIIHHMFIECKNRKVAKV